MCGEEWMRWLKGVDFQDSHKTNKFWGYKVQHDEYKVKVKSLRHVRLFATPWTVAYQASPPMRFSR